MSAALAQLDELTASLRQRVDAWCRQVEQAVRHVDSPAGFPRRPAAGAAPTRRTSVRPLQPAAGGPADSPPGRAGP